MTVPAEQSFTLYSRQGCHLCEQMIEELLPMLGRAWRLEVVDIDQEPTRRAEYDTAIPVLEFAGREICRHRLDGAAIRQILGA